MGASKFLHRILKFNNYANLCILIQKQQKMLPSLFHSGFWFCLFYLIGLGGGFETFYTELWNSLIMQIYANLYSKSMKNAASPLFRNHNRSALEARTYITHRVIYYSLVSETIPCVKYNNGSKNVLLPNSIQSLLWNTKNSMLLNVIDGSYYWCTIGHFKIAPAIKKGKGIFTLVCIKL